MVNKRHRQLQHLRRGLRAELHYHVITAGSMKAEAVCVSSTCTCLDVRMGCMALVDR
jgi:hypothetical protein